MEQASWPPGPGLRFQCEGVALIIDFPAGSSGSDAVEMFS